MLLLMTVVSQVGVPSQNEAMLAVCGRSVGVRGSSRSRGRLSWNRDVAFDGCCQRRHRLSPTSGCFELAMRHEKLLLATRRRHRQQARAQHPADETVRGP